MFGAFRLFLLAAGSCIIVLAACQNRQKQRTIDHSSSGLYLDYRIWGEDGGAVTCMLQFRAGNADGPTLLLKDPAQVQIDSAVLAPDSTQYQGIYYELVSDPETFTGRHQIVFVDSAGNHATQEFSFAPLSLAEEPADSAAFQPFTIYLTDTTSLDPVQLVLTDTSFTSRDVNLEVIPSHGTIQVTREMLSNLVPGPINLELSTEKKTYMPHGSLTINYRLTRSFILSGPRTFHLN